MHKYLTVIINCIFFTVIILIAFVVATLALTKKVNEVNTQYNQKLTGTVLKQSVSVLAYSGGIVKKIYVRSGQEVKKNDLVVEVDNPVLRGKIAALEKYPDNVSAQTEAQVAKEQLKGLKIYAPVNGVVSDITASEGGPIEDLAKVLTLYSNDSIQLLVNLTNEQYLAVQQLHGAKAYSARLNQDFELEPDILQPDEKLDQTGSKKIGLYFTFKDKNEAMSLLDNEDLEIHLNTPQEQINKPIDFFVNFWNNLLGKKGK